MTRPSLLIGLLLLIANSVIAALWLTVLHPGSAQQVSHGASATTVGQGMPVGSLLPPPLPDCAPRSVNAVSSPDGRPVAVLAQVPPGLSTSLAVIFTPCGVPSQTPSGLAQALAAGEPSFNILSVVQYQGPDGTMFISTTRPSVAALGQGLDLGDRSFTLTDGSEGAILSSDDAASPYQVRWLKGQIIVSIGGTIPLSELEDLASQVTIKQ